jgi:alanine-alpha-ketoisovalerate/valine-pyruvate aminotransferase
VVVSSAKGNVGEHLIMAELLHRGFDAYWADRGNPAFDIACFWNTTGRSTRLRVKTTHNHSAIWTVKKSGAIFLDLQARDDFVVIADLGSGLRERDVYVIPTEELFSDLQSDHAHYVSRPKRDGTPRKQEQGMRCIRFFGENSQDRLGHGYHLKYASYREAWDSLK